MRAAILSIGSELTSGQTVNTNAAYLARRLQELGIPCVRQLVVADESPRIVEALRELLASTDLLILTGGLGPTFDDLTAASLAQAVDRPLRFVPRAAARVRVFYRQHHRRLNRLALRQAYLPDGAQALPNPVGTAPGIWFDGDPSTRPAAAGLAQDSAPRTAPMGLHGHLIVALPGVPREMQAICEKSVIPRLRQRLHGTPIVSRTIRTIGIVELAIQGVLRRLRIPDEVQVGLYPNLMAVDVRLTVAGKSRRDAERLLDRLEQILRRRLGPVVYGIDEDTLEGIVGGLLVKRRLTLAVAESCTGGLVSDRLTNVPGSSRYLIMSVVAYHNRVKHEVLGVPQAALTRYGAVSAHVAKAMAQGARRCAGTDVGLAVTGIAGPTGATPSKPVGLVYMALATHARTIVERHIFHGDRLAVKSQAAQLALDLLRRRASYP